MPKEHSVHSTFTYRMIAALPLLCTQYFLILNRLAIHGNSCQVPGNIILAMIIPFTIGLVTVYLHQYPASEGSISLSLSGPFYLTYFYILFFYKLWKNAP